MAMLGSLLYSIPMPRAAPTSTKRSHTEDVVAERKTRDKEAVMKGRGRIVQYTFIVERKFRELRYGLDAPSNYRAVC